MRIFAIHFILLIGLIVGQARAEFSEDHFIITFGTETTNGQASVGYAPTPGVETLGHAVETDEGKKLSSGQITVLRWLEKTKSQRLFSVVSGEWNAKDRSSRLIIVNQIPVLLKSVDRQRVTVILDEREIVSAYPPLYLKPGRWVVRVGPVEDGK